jgi:hypothetical protein
MYSPKRFMAVPPFPPFAGQIMEKKLSPRLFDQSSAVTALITGDLDPRRLRTAGIW